MKTPSSSLFSQLLWSLSLLMLITSLLFSSQTKTMLLEWDLTVMSPTPVLFYMLLDPMGLLLSSVVLFISANILQFATFYMMEEKFLARFIHLVMLFVLSMNMLIFIPHLMFLLLGWDGLGLTSFLLVIYYYSPKALGAGLITAFTNRIGDVLILAVISWSLISSQWQIINMWQTSMDSLMVMFLCLAAMTKSAQIPFSSWLPAAMAAPTPVSALVHSSTLVTAGVFLLIRFHTYLSKSLPFSTFLLMMASLTMCMAGLAALVETDLKKIIALSTLSQLGVMMSSIAMGLPTLALFHLITHAMFKALLFVCAGTIIHSNSHTQDLRHVGQILSQMPTTAACFYISNMALCAIPFMAGFYSKDLILETALFSKMNSSILLLFTLGTTLTAIYSLRFLLTAWASMYSHAPLHALTNMNKHSTMPASILSGGAIMGGSMLNWVMITPSIEPMLNISSKMAPFIVTMMGFIVAFTLATTSTALTLIAKLISYTMTSMWFLTPLSSQMMLKVPFTLSLAAVKNLDQGWNESLGGQGLMKFSSTTSMIQLHPQINTPTIHLTMMSILFAPFILSL